MKWDRAVEIAQIVTAVGAGCIADASIRIVVAGREAVAEEL